MGINDEYSRDAYLGDHYAYNSDEEHDEFDSQLDPEDWQAVYSEDLLDAWMIIYDELSRQYLTHIAKYSQFVEFVMEPSKWRTHSEFRPIHTLLWNQISVVDTIKERVTEDQFHGWAQQYLRALTH